MQLVINTPGAFVSMKDGCFQIKVEGKTQAVSSKKVNSILITAHSFFTSDAVQLAV